MPFHSSLFRKAAVGILVVVTLMALRSTPALASASSTAQTAAAGDGGDFGAYMSCSFKAMFSHGFASAEQGACMQYCPQLGACIGNWVTGGVQSVLDSVETLITMTPGKLFSWIFSAIGSIFGAIAGFEVMLIALVANPIVFRFATSPFVHAGWYTCLQVANMIIVLGMMLLANRMILGKEKFGDYSKLMKYIVAALFLNFSLTIAGFVIQISNLLTLAFLTPLGQPTVANPSSTDFMRNFSDRFATIFANLSYVNEARSNAGALGDFANGFLLVLFSCILVVALGAILFGFLKRVIMLWSLLIVLPLAYVSDLIGVKVPGVSGAWGDWQKNFLKELTFGPVMAFFLWLILMIMSRIGSAYANDPNLSVQTSGFQHILEFAVFIGLLIFGFKTATGASGGAFKGFEQAIDRVGGLPQDIANKIGSGIKQGFNSFTQYGKAQLGKSIAESDAAKGFVARFGGSKIGFLNRMATNLQATGDKSGDYLKKEMEKNNSVVSGLSFDQLYAGANNSAKTEAYRAACWTQMQNEKHRSKLAYKITSADDLDTAKKQYARFGVEFKPDDVLKYRPSLITDTAKRREAVQSLTSKDLMQLDTSELKNASVAQNFTANQITTLIASKPISASYTVGDQRDFVNQLGASNQNVWAELSQAQAMEMILRSHGVYSKRKILESIKASKDSEFRKKLAESGPVSSIILSVGCGAAPILTAAAAAALTAPQRDARLDAFRL